MYATQRRRVVSEAAMQSLVAAILRFHYTYPDAAIVCGELEFDDEQHDTITNPTVIVEVLSDSTEKYDRGRKADHYRQIASLKELVLIAQDHPHIERFTRRPDGGWLFHEEKNLTASFELPSLRISVTLS